MTKLNKKLAILLLLSAKIANAANVTPISTVSKSTMAADPTSFRGGDTIDLKFEDVNKDGQQIKIVDQKGNAVANATYDSQSKANINLPTATIISPTNNLGGVVVIDEDNQGFSGRIYETQPQGGQTEHVLMGGIKGNNISVTKVNDELPGITYTADDKPIIQDKKTGKWFYANNNPDVNIDFTPLGEIVTYKDKPIDSKEYDLDISKDKNTIDIQDNLDSSSLGKFQYKSSEMIKPNNLKQPIETHNYTHEYNNDKNQKTKLTASVMSYDNIDKAKGVDFSHIDPNHNYNFVVFSENKTLGSSKEREGVAIGLARTSKDGSSAPELTVFDTENKNIFAEQPESTTNEHPDSPPITTAPAHN